jgi:hypothetical protein
MVTEKSDQEKPEKENNANGGGADQAQFTQEQLDAIIKDRLERANNKITSDLMAQLGIEDIDEAKKAIEEAAKLKEAQMTELEKAQAQVTEAMNQAAQAKAETEAMQAKANEALLKSAIIAKSQDFNDPMDAYTFVNKAKIEVSEDGEYKGIDEALKELAETKPYLVRTENTENGKGPGTPTRATPKTVAERLFAQRDKQNEGPKDAEELRREIRMTF